MEALTFASLRIALMDASVPDASLPCTVKPSHAMLGIPASAGSPLATRSALARISSRRAG